MPLAEVNIQPSKGPVAWAGSDPSGMSSSMPSGHDDGRDGQAQGVDHANPQGAAAGVGVAVDTKANVETLVDIDEVEVELDAAFAQVAGGLGSKEPEDTNHADQDEDLGDPLDNRRVAVQGYAFVLSRLQRVIQ